MIKGLIKLEAGTTLKINLELNLGLTKDKFYSEESFKEYLKTMVEYYFTGDPTIIYKYFKQDYILDHNI